MKKWIVIALVLGNLVLLLFLLPRLFADEIKAKLMAQINQRINATAFVGDFDASLVAHFPLLSVSLQNFGLANRAPFAGDTLLTAEKLEVGIDFWSVLSGQYQVKGVWLTRPRVQVRVLTNGEANYHIMLPDEAAPSSETDTAGFSAQVDEWAITDGYLSYLDRSTGTRVLMQGLQHRGSGNFAADQFDLKLFAHADSLTVEQGGTNYLNKKQLETDMVLDIDLNNYKFTIKENYTRLNDFQLNLAGWLALPATGGYDLDLQYTAPQTTFKNLLSLVPGAYTASYQDLKAEGDVQFNGWVRGRYDEARQQLPGFNLALQVRNGWLQYPAVPTPVRNVNLDLQVDNPNGVLEQTVVDCKKFALDLGGNPVTGRVRVKGLTRYQLDADVKAKLNLAELTKVFPIKDLTLKGLYDLQFQANGTYDSAQKIIPKIDAAMSLQNGYVKSTAHPFPIENLELAATAKNPTGRLADTEVVIERSSLTLEGKPFRASGSFRDLDDLAFKVDIQGEVDLAKLTKIYPLDGMTLSGLLQADVHSQGRLSDAQAQRYDKLPTSGTASVRQFTFTSASLAQPIKITEAQASFSPQKITLSQFKGFFGNSDVALSGDLTNYLAYLLQKEAVLKGKLQLDSRRFNLNEWMADDDQAAKTDTALAVVQVPANLDFAFDANFGQLQYSTWQLDQAQGQMLVRGGVVQLNNFAFNYLGGQFVTKGSYDPRNLAKPTFSFGLNIKDVSIPGAYKAFSPVRAFAPIAQWASGLFSGSLTLAGDLQPDLMPNFTTLSGGGLVNVLETGLQKLAILDQVSNLTGVANLKNFSNLKLRNFNFKADLVNGKLFIPPTDLKISDYAANLAGSVGIDGSLDYVLRLNLPKNQLAAQLSQQLDQYVGGKQAANQNVEVHLAIGGTFARPAVKLIKGGTEAEIRKEIAAKVEVEKQAAKEIAKETAKTLLDDLVSSKLKPKPDSTQQATTDSTGAPKPAPRPQERLKDAANQFLDRFRRRPAPAPAPTPADTLKKTEPDTTKTSGG
ncbi:MAG: hypothetical protein MUC97_03445 [Bernardetiaceae bacterium]|nr:hypothetical protein [Bernardetiaceae bacterium]